MKSLLFFIAFLVSGNLALCQTFNPFYANVANSCDQDTVTAYLQQFEDLGIKELNNPALTNTKDWIVQKYSNWGYTDIVEDDFNVFGTNTMTNIIVTKTGTLYPDTYVIIDAHYDTKNGPGANDNGTGTVILLELARLIKDIPTEYSIKFIHFSGEEIGFEGSEHYVDNIANPNNMDIKVVFNIDQVGGTAGMINNTIVCERDQSVPNTNDAQSAVLTNELATCTALYSSLQTEISIAYGSDYVPFMINGYYITGYYEKNASPYTHSIEDSVIYMDLPYLYQVTKGAMGALLHYAVASEDLGMNDPVFHSSSLFPNPANEWIYIELPNHTEEKLQITILDLSGSILQTETVSKKSDAFSVNVSALAAGSYLLQATTEHGMITKRFIRD